MTNSTDRNHSTTALLAVVCLAQFMVLLDVTIVNIALPSIQEGLGFSREGLQWVVNAYTITFAGFLMLGGRLADLLGRRRVFVAGTALFAITSLACAVSSSQGMLIAARALQGLAGAIVSPATLSIITSSLPEGPERNRGLAAWGAVGALGGALGALLGGLLTQGFGWPAIFAINLPLGVVIIAGALRFIEGERPAQDARHFDLAGATLITGGLAALTFAVVQTDRVGWTSPGVLVPLAAAVVLLAGFLIVEDRLSAAPLVPLRLFAIGHVRAANLIVGLLYAAFFPMFFFLTLYLQEVLGYDPIETGVAFLPLGLAVFAGSTVAPRIVGRFGPRPVITAGMVTATAGMLLLTGIEPGRSHVWLALAGGFLTMVGLGLSLVPGTIAAVRGLPPELAGFGSGLLNTSRLLGGALGLAVLSTVAIAQTRADASEGPAASLADGFGHAFALGAVFCAIGAAIALVFLRERCASHPDIHSPAIKEA